MSTAIPSQSPAAAPAARASRASRPVYFILLIFAAVFAFVGLSKLRDKEIIPWRDDFTAAKTEAVQQRKPIFAYFTASWCGPCQYLKSTTWADKSVDAALRDFVPVKIDIDASPALATDYGIRAVPTFVILDATGAEQSHTTGALGPADFLTWLNSSRNMGVPPMSSE